MVPRALRRPRRHPGRGSRARLALGSTRQPQQQCVTDTRRVVRDERELTRAMRY
jgi:hypothetical protein